MTTALFMLPENFRVLISLWFCGANSFQDGFLVIKRKDILNNFTHKYFLIVLHIHVNL